MPPVVVADEVTSGRLIERCSIPPIRESVYAITAQRRFAHPLLRRVLEPAGARAARGP